MGLHAHLLDVLPYQNSINNQNAEGCWESARIL
jgi:hypothetical protein